MQRNLKTIFRFVLQKEELDCINKMNGLVQIASKQGNRIPVTNSQEFLSAKIKETEQIMK